MKYTLLLLLAFALYNCSGNDPNLINGFEVIEDSAFFYNDTIAVSNGPDIIYKSPHQEARELEMPVSFALLHMYSYYRDELPSSYVMFPSPQHLYWSIPDTLHNTNYTYYISQQYVAGYLGGFEMDKAKFFGVSVQSNSDTVFVTSVFENSAADVAGIKRGDKIVAVDKFQLYGNISVYNAVIKDNSKEYSFVIAQDSTLDTIKMSKAEMTVPASYADSLTADVGYVKLTSFIADSSNEDGSTSHQFNKALKATAKFPVTIVDLRGNGGGYISESFYCSNFFLKDGDSIILEEAWVPTDEYIGAGSMVKEIATAEGDGEHSDRKFVFLIDGGSASASEILLSAIKYNTDIPVVGKKTYGKGIGQTSITALNGARAHVTRLKLFMPDGTNYHQVGFSPDYEVEGGHENFKDLQLNKAIEIANSLTPSLGKTMDISLSKYSEFDAYQKNYLEFPGLGFNNDVDIKKLLEGK